MRLSLNGPAVKRHLCPARSRRDLTKPHPSLYIHFIGWGVVNKKLRLQTQRIATIAARRMGPLRHDTATPPSLNADTASGGHEQFWKQLTCSSLCVRVSRKLQGIIENTSPVLCACFIIAYSEVSNADHRSILGCISKGIHNRICM